MEPLTDAQSRVFDYIRQRVVDAHLPPTRAEIAKARGFASANAAQSHLRSLARKGHIILESGNSRGIRLSEHAAAEHESTNMLDLAVIGRAAAGTPMLAVENTERSCRVDRDLFAVKPDYLLRVRGDSMIGAGIFDRDLLAVARRHPSATMQSAFFAPTTTSRSNTIARTATP